LLGNFQFLQLPFWVLKHALDIPTFDFKLSKEKLCLNNSFYVERKYISQASVTQMI